MKLIVGLGNPGRRYENTKHNIGFRVIDAFHEKVKSDCVFSRDNSIVVQTQWGGMALFLAKPLTYMNNSGAAVAALVNRLKLPLTELCVVYDDIHLDIGVIRIRRKGSAGGHNGMKSIIRHLNTNEFPRLRIGIGEPSGTQVDYVLSEFSDSELPEIKAAVARATEAVEIFVCDGILTTMNQFNGR